MGPYEPSIIIEVDNLAAVYHDREILCFPENRCTDFTWADCRDNQMEYYVMSSGSFATWYSTPTGEPVFPRMQNEQGKEATTVDEIEVYYRARILDPALITARRQVIIDRARAKKVVTEPKIPKHIEEFAREFYGFVNARRNIVETKKVQANGCNLFKNTEHNIAFNVYDDNCNVYGLGNIGSFLNKAKLFYAPVQKPVVKLQTLKIRLDDALSRQRTLGHELILLTGSLKKNEADLLEAETMTIDEDNLFTPVEVQEIEEIISSLTIKVSKTQLQIVSVNRELERLGTKIPEMEQDIADWSNVGTKKSVPVSTDLAFVWRVIKFLNKWNHEAFWFLDALNAHANSYKPKDETTEYIEELKSMNIVLNIRTQPAAKRQATIPVSAVAATPVAATVAPAAPAAPAPAAPAPVRQQRPQAQTQARPAQSRLARLGMGKKQ
jgi:hypothetical protein